jgi:hypothetical protein
MVSELIKEKLLSLNGETVRNLRLSQTVKHPGEGGRARENVIAHFLRTLIPTAFSVSTGFILDARGKISPQIDIIISRQGHHPVIEVGGIRHFIIESVHAIIENKARIDSRKALNDAMEKIRFVRAMDRTNMGRNYTVLGGGTLGDPVDPNRFTHQIMGGIITEKSLNLDSFRREMTIFRRANPRSVWPSFYADVNRFAALYLTADKSGATMATADPMEANYSYVTDRRKPNFVPPLIEAGMMLLSFLRAVPIIDYAARDYILAASASGDASDL